MGQHKHQQRDLLVINVVLFLFPFLVREIVPYGVFAKIPNNFLSANFPSKSIESLARLVSVRVLTEKGDGSGVIVKRQGDRYLILTNDHVINDKRNRELSVVTNDGLSHSAQKMPLPANLKNLDLAILQFQSNKSYTVVRISNTSVENGDIVYGVGFPSWYWQNDSPLATRNWQVQRAFKFASGQIEMFLDKSLFRGYQIGYTSNIESGMSGGAILNESGELVGLNGRLKQPFYGITTFLFIDGTLPSKQQFYKMNKLSWGIPISSYFNSLHLMK
jgi:S1-C subfamily serine protease